MIRKRRRPGNRNFTSGDRQGIVTLAGRADDNSNVGADLIEIAAMSADRVAGVSYASVTSRYEGAYATVAASSKVAVAVDEAQYADDAGPCLDALAGAYPTAVPDIAATITDPPLVGRRPRSSAHRRRSRRSCLRPGPRLISWGRYGR